MARGGDIPHLIYGTQEDYKKLYFSEPTAALKVPVTVSPGWGVLKMGTVMALNASAAGRVGQCFPYDPSGSITGAENAPGRTYVVSNVANGTAIADVLINESYRFIVGDDLIIMDSDGEGALDNGGAIISIDRTTYTNFARITFTTNVGDDFTTAKFAFVAPEGLVVAVGILEKSIDTGSDQNAQGAVATLILGNAVLYSGMLLNLDSNAQTDLSASTFGQFTYIR